MRDQWLRRFSNPKVSSGLSYQETICAALRGESIPWAYANEPAVYREFTQCADYHGATALLYYALKQSGSLSSWPVKLVQRLRGHAMNEAAREAIRSRELTGVLRELAREGVCPLLLKGTPLAYTLYPEPALRQRSDTDMLIRQVDRGALSQVLARLGYLRRKGVEGEFVSSQSTFSRSDPLGISHDLDVHWRTSNVHLFGAALSYDELANHAIPVSPLGSHARTLRPIDALMLASMHRLGHQQSPYYVDGEAHYDSNRLIWLYDICLLSRSLSDAQWENFIQLAREKGLQEVCLDGLRTATKVFGTLAPGHALQRLAVQKYSQVISVARFQAPRWRWELGQICALLDWRKRMQLVCEQLFPSVDYIVEKYQTRNRGLLPLLYVRRVLHGILKRLG